MLTDISNAASIIREEERTYTRLHALTAKKAVVHTAL
jgi:hypothetical protein